jgi:hypothetical protein
MKRDIDFELPGAEKVPELIALCHAEGWAVDPVMDVFNYREGVPYLYVAPGEDVEQTYIPERTYSAVSAHKRDFRAEEIDEIWAAADRIAAKVGAEVTGGGTWFRDEEE